MTQVEDAKEKNNETAVDRKREGGRDKDGTVELVEATGTVQDLVAALAIV